MIGVPEWETMCIRISKEVFLLRSVQHGRLYARIICECSNYAGREF